MNHGISFLVWAGMAVPPIGRECGLGADEGGYGVLVPEHGCAVFETIGVQMQERKMRASGGECRRKRRRASEGAKRSRMPVVMLDAPVRSW